MSAANLLKSFNSDLKKPELIEGYQPDSEYKYIMNPSVIGEGLSQASTPSTPPAADAKDTSLKEMAKAGASTMNTGGSLGSTLTGAGIFGLMSNAGSAAAAAGPYALGAGLLLSAYEQSKQADALNEQARVAEAQNRKAAVQNALTNALSATKMLGV